MATGMYNLGFMGTGVGSIDSGFLEFWKTRLERDAVVDFANMLFTDQRWVDFIDCFPHHVIRDPGCNVAYWNIGQRPLTRQGDVISADGRPLVFFHFSGLDPTRPHLLSVNQGERRVSSSATIRSSPSCAAVIATRFWPKATSTTSPSRTDGA